LGIGDTRVVHDPDQPGLGTTLKRGDQEKDAGEAYNEGRDQYDQAKEGVKNTAVDNANQVAGDVDQNATTDDKGEKADIAKKSVKDKLFGLKDRIPEEHRQKVGDIYNENLGKTKQFLKDEFPEERRDQFIYRLKKVCSSLIFLCDARIEFGLKGHRRMSKTRRLSTSVNVVPLPIRNLFGAR
jgi:hypothetical protein